eukprot:1120670-Rhodomonas_salina.1
MSHQLFVGPLILCRVKLQIGQLQLARQKSRQISVTVSVWPMFECCPPGPTPHKSLILAVIGIPTGRSILAEIYNCFNV